MLRNAQIAEIQGLESRTLFSADVLQVAALHGQFGVQSAELHVTAKHSSQAAAEAKAARIAARQEALAEKKAAQQAAQTAKAAAKAAKQAAKHGAVTPTMPTTPSTPTEPTALPEPAVTGGNFHYQSFSSDPLFAAGGPSENDINQGDIGDCYFLATLSAVAKTDPNLIKNSITELSNGDFEVAFHRNGQTVDEVVDNALPVAGNGNLAYAQLGQGNCLWVAIMEKAFCAFGGNNSYNSIAGGWMDTAFEALGAAPSDLLGAPNGTALLSAIQGALNAGEAVTIAINQPEDGAPVVGDHAYTVDSIATAADGTLTLTVRNPWGFAGAGSDPTGSAYVTLTAQQAIDSMIGVVAAFV
ncbi:MAG TPA: C2 family cysteine protease [Tepidisphaeraceae bacterium]|nr:C2 family cysteine protease [Tepidisphaeraceae bacterium]